MLAVIDDRGHPLHQVRVEAFFIYGGAADSWDSYDDAG
jgi:hypothetical protein